MPKSRKKDDDLAEIPFLKGKDILMLIPALFIHFLPLSIALSLLVLIPQILVTFFWEISLLFMMLGFLYWFHSRYNPTAVQSFWELISLAAHQAAQWADKKSKALPPGSSDDPS